MGGSCIKIPEITKGGWKTGSIEASTEYPACKKEAADEGVDCCCDVHPDFVGVGGVALSLALRRKRAPVVGEGMAVGIPNTAFTLAYCPGGAGASSGQSAPCDGDIASESSGMVCFPDVGHAAHAQWCVVLGVRPSSR